MYLQAAPAPYSGCKGVGIALLLGSLGWLVADSPLAAGASCALGAALLTYGWARAPFARLTIADMWSTPTTSAPEDAFTHDDLAPGADPHLPTSSGPFPPPATNARSASAEGREPVGSAGHDSPTGDDRSGDQAPANPGGTDDVAYVRRTGSTAYGRRSALPAILARLHAEFATPLRVQQWRRNRPEQP